MCRPGVVVHFLTMGGREVWVEAVRRRSHIRGTMVKLQKVLELQMELTCFESVKACVHSQSCTWGDLAIDQDEVHVNLMIMRGQDPR